MTGVCGSYRGITGSCLKNVTTNIRRVSLGTEGEVDTKDQRYNKYGAGNTGGMDTHALRKVGFKARSQGRTGLGLEVSSTSS